MNEPGMVAENQPFYIRPAMLADSPALIALIDGVYQEYGDRICLENYDADLLDVPKPYTEQGGAIVVACEIDGTVAGVHAAVPLVSQPGVFTFRRLYVGPKYRGVTPVGHMLMHWALDYARQHGALRIEFWSDTRFHRAHRFFEKFGFKTTGQTRQCTDSWEPYWEYFYYLDL
jgi:putative acetyltransferase